MSINFRFFLLLFVLVLNTTPVAAFVATSSLPLIGKQECANTNKDHRRRVLKTTTTTKLYGTAADTDNIISSLSSTYIEKSNYEALLNWLQNNGGKVVVDDNGDSSIYFAKSNAGGGYGAFVSRDIEKDELLYSVPRRACVTLGDALDDPDCGTAFIKVLEKAGTKGGATVIMAAYLAKEYLVMQESGSSSRKFGPYLETLPWKRGMNNQEHILFWSDENIESTLGGSFCYREAKEIRQEVEFALKVIEDIVEDTVRLARGEQQQEEETGLWSKIPKPWEIYSKISADNSDKAAAATTTLDGLDLAVRGAFVTLLTRSFQNNEDSDDYEEEKLVPLLDMLQHNDEANIRHSTISYSEDERDDVVEVRARRAIQKGEELYNQYISEDDANMPYHRFFTRFGFVPGIIDTEDPILDLFKDKSSIFYPKVVEV